MVLRGCSYALGALPEGGSGRDAILTAALSGAGVSSGFVTEGGQRAEHLMFGVRRESPEGRHLQGWGSLFRTRCLRNRWGPSAGWGSPQLSPQLPARCLRIL